MKRGIPWVPVAFFFAAAVLFYFSNRAAYQGYFSDDDFDNLGWPTYAGSDTFYKALVSPQFQISNFRPVGFLYYRLLGPAFQLNYPAYVKVIQGLHLLNAILMFFLLRRLNLTDVAAGSGAFFFAFQAAVLAAYWKPMYVFDLLCATLCLATLLLYIRGRWLLALLTFWLAYKSKELAVMLPVGLLAYEWLLGPRKWKRLIPFFAISLSFGLQALWQNAHLTAEDVYALSFTPHLVWRTISFYSSSIFFLPFAGLALLALPALVRDRRLYLGVILMVSLLLPLLFLSKRFADAYWYVPSIGLAVAAAGLAARVPRWAVALFFVLWLPLNYAMLRTKRRDILAWTPEARAYMAGLLDYAKRTPPVNAVVFEGTPAHMQPWGIKGAIRLAFGQRVATVWKHDPDIEEALANVPVAIVTYYPVPQIVKGRLRTRKELESSIDFRDNVPFSQFGEGWPRDDYAHPARRIVSPAEVTLFRPAEAKDFAIYCSAAPQVGPAQVIVLEDGHSLGALSVGPAGQMLRWKLNGGAPGNRRILIRSEPIGINIRSLGYE